MKFIDANKDFQTSINIGYDLGTPEKVKSLIPTDTVCHYLEDILQDVMTPSKNRAKSLVAPYGSGKSHITLAAISSMWIKDSNLYTHIVKTYTDRRSEFAEDYASFVASGLKILPIVIIGSSADLRHSLLFSLRNALRSADLDNLMPSTNFDGALKTIARWKEHFPETLEKFELMTGHTEAEYCSLLNNLDTAAYNEFIEVYPKLTAGSSFDAFENADVIGIFEKVLVGLKANGINGMYVVYDEFSKYLEANITSASVEDIKLLQDFAEKCARSSQDMQLHLLLISHKTLANYIDSKLPKNKRDGWNGVSGRFDEIEIRTDFNQAYELISHAIIKKEPEWSEWLKKHESMLALVEKRYLSSKSSDLIKGVDSACLIYGCYPLHPVSTCLLPRLSSKVAQNERTLFTFLCSNDEYGFKQAVSTATNYVSPDAVFDYFEPLIRKEYYTSDIRRIYSLTRKALNKISDDSLGRKIIKSIALITIVQQYRLVDPTRQTIIDIYSDCGYKESEIEETVARLIEADSIVYLKESNGYLRLKESSGVNIERRLREKTDLLLERMTPSEILNASQLMNAIYPSKYNEENDIVRYFDCRFLPVRSILEEGTPKIQTNSNGIVIAAFPSDSDEMSIMAKAAGNYTKKHPLSVVVVPKEYEDIHCILYRFEAAKELKAENSEDSILSEEYSMVADDCGEIVHNYIDGFFRPEQRKATYYANGSEVAGITRRRKLSELLSDLCTEVFPFTPKITHETLNKNILTGTGLSSRSKLLIGLFVSRNEPNLGFTGSGQEVAMARSALKNTGIIKDMEHPEVSLDHAEDNLMRAINLMREFLARSNGDTFNRLYADLTGQKYGIGMKRGPIPLYLALVLQEFQNEIIIERFGEEKTLDAALIRDIDSHPEEYSVKLMDWTEEKAAYVENLALLFGRNRNANRTEVASAMRMWFVSLPQITRNSMVNHSGNTNINFKQHRAFFEELKKAESDSSELLFNSLPKTFGENIGSPELLKKIEDEKRFSDSFVSATMSTLASDLKLMLCPNAHADASLHSVIQDWIDLLPEESKTFVFSSLTNQIMVAFRDATNDASASIQRIAKAATTLHIIDWKDARFEDFEKAILAAKREIETASNKNRSSQQSEGCLSIKYFDDDEEKIKTFGMVEYSNFAKMLRRDIDSCLDDMGGAVSDEQKRQVVFDVLRSLC